MAATCPQCGIEQRDGVQFCVDCGTALGRVPESSAPPPLTPKPPADPSAPRFGSDAGPQAFPGERKRHAPPASNAAPVPDIGPMQEAKSLNSMAILAFVAAFLLPPLGVILGAIAYAKIKSSNPKQSGEGLAIAAMGIGGIITLALCSLTALVPNVA